MSRLRAIGELTRVRFLRFIREKESVFWVFLFPLILALVLGIAFKDRGVSPVKVGVLDQPGAQPVRAALERADHIEVARFASRDEAAAKLRNGAVDALVIPGEPLVFRFDPTRPESDTARLRVEDALQRAAGRRDPLRIDREEATETGSRYIDFLIPGLLAMNLMGTCIWGIGFGLVSDRQRKLLKRMLVTPMRRADFLFSFILSRAVFLVLEVVVILVFAVWVLDVPLNGSLLGLGVTALVGMAAFTALGILLASRAETIEGISGLANAFTLPMWLLSGVFFSYERFPELFHPLIKLLPLTALADALRANMLEGAGLTTVIPELGILAAWAVICFSVALRIFRWS